MPPPLPSSAALRSALPRLVFRAGIGRFPRTCQSLRSSVSACAAAPHPVPPRPAAAVPKPLPALGEVESEHTVDAKARMLIGFTCTVCRTRQYKTMSKLAYTKGVVLIQCDGCSNRHLIADNLGWFRDKKVNVEDLVRENGESEVIRQSPHCDSRTSVRDGEE